MRGGASEAPGGEGWEVRLSSSAEEAVRRAGPVALDAVGAVLDEVGRRGPDAADGPGTPTRLPGRSERVVVHEVTRPAGTVRVVFDLHARRALVVSVAVGRPRRPSGASARAGWGWGPFAELGSDLRVACRGLLRAPAFSLAVVLTLTLGLGGTTAILGLVHTVYWSVLPFAESEELVRLRNFARTASGERIFNLTPRDFHRARSDARVFEGVVAMAPGSMSLLEEGGARRVSAVGVSEGWSDLLGIRPALGRAFTADEMARGPESGVVLISHGVWEQVMGGAPDVVGRTLPTAAGPREIVGVMQPRFAYPYDAGVWYPGRFDESDWEGNDLNVVARLRDGADVEGARADMERLYRALREAEPGATPDDGIHVASLRDDFIRDHAESLQGLSVAVVFLFLLACANVGGLLSLRRVERERETTLRAALGASRFQVARLAMVESLLLFLVGGGGGLLLAMALADAAGSLIPGVLRRQLDLATVRFDPWVVAAAVGLSVLAGLATGAAAAARASGRDLRTVLGEGRGGGPGRRARTTQDVLVASEVALALVLLVGAGVLFRTFLERSGADLGYQTADRVTLQMAMTGPRYADGDARLTFLAQLEERVGALPEVARVGITSVNPLCCGDWGASIEAEGAELPPDAPPILIHHRYVTPGYFEAMDIPFLAGRNFGPVDRPDAPPTVVVDEGLARRLWPGEDPLGKRLRLVSEGGPYRTVVGVVPRVHREGDYTEGWYLPLTQGPTARSTEILHLMIETRGDGALAAVRRTLAELDPALGTFGGATLASLRAERLGQDRTGAVLSGAFAAVGVLLACLGLYGLLAYRVALRARELGTRMALGARRREVVALVLRRSAALLGPGLAVGVVLALALNRVLMAQVLGVEMAPPGLVAALVGVLALAALVASAVPALRAASIDPARTLQEG